MYESSHLMLIHFNSKKQNKYKHKVSKIKTSNKNYETVLIYSKNKKFKKLTYNNFFTRFICFTGLDK